MKVNGTDVLVVALTDIVEWPIGSYGSLSSELYT